LEIPIHYNVNHLQPIVLQSVRYPTMKKPSPTPYVELNGVLHELVSRIKAILGSDFVGAYLQGSFALGDFDQHSDVDFIIITEAELTPEQVAALQAMHPRIYALPSAWAQHLEGSYFPRRIFKDYSYRGGSVWYLDHGSTALIQSNHCNTIVVRWTLREHGVTLAGPPPNTLVDPIPARMLRQEISAVITDWGQEILDDPDRYRNHFYQGFIVLSYCRMLHSLHTGDLGSKRSGAEWAKDNLDPSWSGLIDRAWNARPDPATSSRRSPDPVDYDDTLRFVRYCIAKSRGLSP
jgi:hypothetical protein